MLLKVLFVICLIVEAISTPWYLKALWPEKCFKSLCLKMVCSAMFFSVGLLSMFIAGNFSHYAVMMLIGLGFGWIGDYFLHAKTSNTYFAIGFLSFLVGHIVYIIAFVKTLPLVVDGYNQFNLVEVLSVILIVAVLSIIAVTLLKIKFNPDFIKYAILVYAIILLTMAVKSVALGIGLYHLDPVKGLWALICLSAGSFLFVCSDASLAVILFAGKNKNYPLKIFNIVTYFWGQILLASSILFINV